MNGEQIAWIFLQVKATLSKPSGKVCVMMFSRSSVGRSVSAMVGGSDCTLEGALARFADEHPDDADEIDY